MQILDPNAFLNMEKEMEGNNVNKYKKYLKDIIGIYKNQSIMENHLMYEVYTSDGYDKNHIGSLSVGLTVMYPVLIDEECNMTRGHFHENTECSEIYVGVQGDGLLLLMSEDGNTWAEKVFEGSIHYIDGRIAHRLVNTSDKVLKVGAIWSQYAGHDYSRVEKMPFKYRVFNNDGEISFVEE